MRSLEIFWKYFAELAFVSKECVIDFQWQATNVLLILKEQVLKCVWWGKNRATIAYLFKSSIKDIIIVTT